MKLLACLLIIGLQTSGQDLSSLKQQLRHPTENKPTSDTVTPDAHVIPAGPVTTATPAAESVSEYYVVMFTADWCGPCQQWKRTELPKLKTAGIRVEMIDIDKNKALANDYGIRSIPAFQVAVEGTRKLRLPSRTDKRRHYGNVNAATLLAAIEGLNPTNLTQLIATDRKAHPVITTDVEPRSRVWIHLVEHGWNHDRIKGLNMPDALQLHDMTHAGRVAP